jgi:hypothetical protein
MERALDVARQAEAVRGSLACLSEHRLDVRGDDAMEHGRFRAPWTIRGRQRNRGGAWVSLEAVLGAIPSRHDIAPLRARCRTPLPDPWRRYLSSLSGPTDAWQVRTAGTDVPASVTATAQRVNPPGSSASHRSDRDAPSEPRQPLLEIRRPVGNLHDPVGSNLCEAFFRDLGPANLTHRVGSGGDDSGKQYFKSTDPDNRTYELQTNNDDDDDPALQMSVSKLRPDESVTATGLLSRSAGHSPCRPPDRDRHDPVRHGDRRADRALLRLGAQYRSARCLARSSYRAGRVVICTRPPLGFNSARDNDVVQLLAASLRASVTFARFGLSPWATNRS